MRRTQQNQTNNELNQKLTGISILQGLNGDSKNIDLNQDEDFCQGKTPKYRINSKTNQFKPKTKKQWLWEFSKKIVVLVAIAFFIVLLYTLVYLVFNPDGTGIQFLLDNMSDIFKITVVSYAVKAGFENIIKIRKYEQEEDRYEE